MPNQGGRYEIRDGKRRLVQRTKPAPDPRPQASAPTAPPKPAAKSAAKQANVKESTDG